VGNPRDARHVHVNSGLFNPVAILTLRLRGLEQWRRWCSASPNLCIVRFVTISVAATAFAGAMVCKTGVVSIAYRSAVHVVGVFADSASQRPAHPTPASTFSWRVAHGSDRDAPHGIAPWPNGSNRGWLGLRDRARMSSVGRWKRNCASRGRGRRSRRYTQLFSRKQGPRRTSMK
jgi:hypothetical protein